MHLIVLNIDILELGIKKIIKVYPNYEYHLISLENVN